MIPIPFLGCKEFRQEVLGCRPVGWNVGGVRSENLDPLTISPVRYAVFKITIISGSLGGPGPFPDFGERGRRLDWQPNGSVDDYSGTVHSKCFRRSSLGLNQFYRLDHGQQLRCLKLQSSELPLDGLNRLQKCPGFARQFAGVFI